jgi:hypothetical protein
MSLEGCMHHQTFRRKVTSKPMSWRRSMNLPYHQLLEFNKERLKVIIRTASELLAQMEDCMRCANSSR